MDLTLFGFQKLTLFLLVLARTAGICTLTPIFGAQQVPAHVRVAVALALAVVFVPMVTPVDEMPVEALPVAIMLVREVIVGLAIGFVCSLVFAAIEIAGQFVDLHAGFSFVVLLDPINNSQVALAARFHVLLAGLLFLVTNSHHLMIRGLADSFDLAPVGQVAMNPAVAGGMVELFSALFAVAIRIAIPIVTAVFMADLSLAVTARVVPQMNVLIVGFPLKLGAGLFGMMVALPVVAGMSQGMFHDMYQQIGGLVSLFGAR